MSKNIFLLLAGTLALATTACKKEQVEKEEDPSLFGTWTQHRETIRVYIRATGKLDSERAVAVTPGKYLTIKPGQVRDSTVDTSNPQPYVYAQSYTPNAAGDTLKCQSVGTLVVKKLTADSLMLQRFYYYRNGSTGPNVKAEEDKYYSRTR